VEINAETCGAIREKLAAAVTLLAQLNDLLPDPPAPRDAARHPEATGDYGLPKGTQDALAWKPGRVHRETGEAQPLKPQAREYLRTLARARGPRGLAWIGAIERAETMADGLDLREHLLAIDPQPVLNRAVEAKKAG
jgi:hypothetical protein